jgi:hypothetical protein
MRENISHGRTEERAKLVMQEWVPMTENGVTLRKGEMNGSLEGLQETA